MNDRKAAGIALVAVSAAGFGALGVLARIAYDDGAEPVAVLMLRFAIAGVAFGVLRRVAGRGRPWPNRRVMFGLAAMGVGYLVQSLCYFSAVDHAPPGLVSLLLYTYPALVVALGAAFLGLRLGRRALLACGLAVVGTIVIVAPSARGGDPLGVVFGLAAACVYAVYILAGSRLLRQVDALTASTVIMPTAAVGFFLVYLVSPSRPTLPRSGSGWLAVVAIALLCTVVAGLTFLAGLARVGPADASTISTIEPVTTVVLSALVTGEAITGFTLAGGGMVLAAVVALSLDPSRPLAPE
jgi:drug/metabolite transporter (DMT)-like permease